MATRYYTEFAVQKLVFIHSNPVKAGLVKKAEEHIYSSPIDYYAGKKWVIKIEIADTDLL